MWPSHHGGKSSATEKRYFKSISRVRGSIVVSISARHADDPGSIPGRGTLLWFFSVLALAGSTCVAAGASLFLKGGGRG